MPALRRVTAARLEAALHKTEEWPWPPGEQVEVVDPVRLRGVIPAPESLAGTTFLDDVDFREATFEGPLDLSHCSFFKRLLLRNAVVRGTLRLDDADILGGAMIAGPPSTGIDLRGARLAGGVSAQRLNAAGVGVDVSGAHLGGDGVFAGARLGSLRARGVRVDGTLNLSAGRPATAGVKFRTDIGAFEAAVRELDLEVANVSGDLLLSGLRVHGPIKLRNAKVAGNVVARVVDSPTSDRDFQNFRAEFSTANLSDIEIHGCLMLHGIRVREQLCLAGANLCGGVQITAAAKRRAAHRREGKHSEDEVRPVAAEVGELNFSNATVEGDLELLGVTVQRVDLTAATVSGSLRIGSDRAWRNRFGGGPVSETGTWEVAANAAARAQTDRNAWLDSLGVSGQRPDSPLASAGAGGAAPALRSTVGALDARNLRTHGAAELSGVDVVGTLDLTGSAPRGGLRIGPDGRNGAFAPEVGGDVHLSAILGAPGVSIEALRCRGEVRVLGSQLGQTSLRPARVGESLVPCAVGLLTVTSTDIAGALQLDILQVDGTKPWAGRRGVWIEGCEVKNDVSFWRPQWTEEVNEGYDAEDLGKLRPWDHGAAVVGPAVIRNCTIGGDCDLTLLKVHGPLRVEECRIGGDLLAASVVTVANEHPLLAAELLQLTPTELSFRAVAPSLSLRNTTIGRDVDLTGLTLLSAADVDGRPSAGARVGHLDARRLAVNGDLIAYAVAARRPECVAFAHVPGAFDLSFGRAAHLVVFGHSFPTDQASYRVSEEGLLLVAGEFRKVTFPFMDRSQYGCPGAMNLADVKVQVWRIGERWGSDGQPADDEPTIDHYDSLLANDRPFRKSTYQAIEHILRNRGRDEDAAEIYRRMRIREREERLAHHRTGVAASGARTSGARAWAAKGWAAARAGWKWLWAPVSDLMGRIAYWASRLLLRFGTSPLRLLFVIFSLALASYPVYCNANNLEPSLEALASVGPREQADSAYVRGRSPRADQWQVLDPLALVIRYHVPFFPVSFHEAWEPRDTPGIVIEAWDRRLPHLPYRPLSRISPEGWAGFMSVLNMLMWPLVLTFLLRRLLRR